MDSLMNDLQSLHSASLPPDVILDYFLQIVEQELRRNISPTFWNQIQTSVSEGSESCELLCSSFRALCDSYSLFSQHIKFCENLCRNFDGGDTNIEVAKYVQQRFQAIMFYVTTEKFDKMIEEFYTAAFRVFNKNHEDPEELDESFNDDSIVECLGCNQLTEECQCQEITETFHTVNKYLNDLGLLERVCTLSVSAIIYEQIKQHIDHTCKGNFETSYIGSLQQWLERKVVGWLTWIYERTTSCALSTTRLFRQNLEQYLFVSYASTRVDELFNIIIEYPESEPAIYDLKICLERTDLRSTLVSSLKNALQTRLLHPGVNTSDILTAYISAIRALRVLDQTGVVLDLVCQPVRKYLRNRSDTVRCIVSSLTEDTTGDLCDELIKRQPLVLDDSCCGEENEIEEWDKWQPDPVDADPGKTSKTRRTSDIISLLVNIYGSKELFVHEYRNLLADRILSQFNYETSKEVRYLELLKLRFGEAQLHYCEVMIKDVADSRRINTHIADERSKQVPSNDGIPVNTMILSAQFWPTFREERIKLPESLQSQLDVYTKSYEQLKGNRTLTWKPHLGLMQIEVELKDRKLNLNVSPVHATILWYFQKEATWTIDDLSAELEMPSHALRRKIVFWQSQGVLREEETDTFVLLEEQKHRPVPNGRCKRIWDIDFELERWDMDRNARNDFRGPSNAIFAQLGRFPQKELFTEEMINNGVPQAGNMTEHLIDLIHDINHPEFLGVCSTEDRECKLTFECEDKEWVCIEVPDWANETKWMYPEEVAYQSKSCVVTDTSSPLYGAKVCGYKHLTDCVPIDEAVCGRVDYSYYGYHCINMESWRPSWWTNWSAHHRFYRTMSIDLLAEELYPDEPRPLNQTMIDLVTLQAVPLFEKWAVEFMVRSLELSKKMRPNANFGYYAFPYCYNLPESNVTECSQSTRDNNDWHAPIWKASSCLQPSVYLYQIVDPLATMRYHYASICEAIRSGQLELGALGQWPMDPAQFWGDNDLPDNFWKCIVPYTTYKHGTDSPPIFVSQSTLKITLRYGALCGLPATYVWGHSQDFIDYIDETTGLKYNTLCETMKNFTQENIGPYADQVIQWAKECAEKRCSNNGRCAHKGCICNDVNVAEEMFQINLDDFDTSDQTQLETDYFCKCLPGYKGNSCQFPKT